MHNKIFSTSLQYRAIQFCLKCFCLLLFAFSTKQVHAEDKKPNLKQLQEHFKDVLLVVYYANPHFETIDFLKQLYSPVFKNIVFYGDRTQHIDIGEFEHVNENGFYDDYRIVYTRNGYYLSRWIKDVLINHPGYDGYLFMQDDVLMQFWNFSHLDKNKIWFGATTASAWRAASLPQEPYIRTNRTTDSEYDHWFNTGAGMPPLKNMFGQLEKIGLDKERAMLSANFGENAAAWFMVDLFYFPGRFAGKILRLCDLFDRVFCEMSIPTMLGAMDYLQNWEEMPHWWTCFDSGEKLKNAYDPSYYWMHPLKFSYEDNRAFVSKVFREQFYDLLNDE